VVTLRGPQVTALRLGYAQHLYRSQGRTVDSTYIVTGGWQTGREAVQTIKTYRLGDDERRTVGHLRLILNQRYLPDHARVSVDGERLTLEWLEVSSR
jgi:hypothetical protein